MEAVGHCTMFHVVGSETAEKGAGAVTNGCCAGACSKVYWAAMKGPIGVWRKGAGALPNICVGKRGCGIFCCWPAKLMCCNASVTEFICSCKEEMLFCTLLWRLVFVSVSWETTEAFEAKSFSKLWTASSNVLLSSCLAAFVVYLCSAAAMIVSLRKLYASCQKVWKFCHVRSALFLLRQSLYLVEKTHVWIITTSADWTSVASGIGCLAKTLYSKASLS